MPIIMLLFASPFVGEYLLGNIPLRELPALPFLIPMYGCGALLIREVARRTGRGWTAILLLGAAYGLIEAGLFDGSLFNPGYENLDFSDGYIASLGFSPYYALHFAVGHAVWSITVPILLVEAIARSRRPWLSLRGLAVTAIVYVLGGLLIQYDSRDQGDFSTSAFQAVGALLAVALLVLLAFLITTSAAEPVSSGSRPQAARGVLVFLGAFVVSAVFFATEASWLGMTVALTALAVSWTAGRRLVHRPWWGPVPEVAAAGGALLTYALAAPIVGNFTGNDDPVTRTGNLLFALLAVAFFALALRRSRTTAREATSSRQSP
jgi:hypothetical protein